MPKQCDGTSVGIVITDPQDRVLMIQRATPPAGLAGIAGHVDDHGTPLDAALAELREEIGLAVTDRWTRMPTLAQAWRPNRCRRRPWPPTVADVAGDGSAPLDLAQALPTAGHRWTVYRLHVTEHPALEPARREVADVRWMDGDGLATAAARTLAYARGEISDQQWSADPGIEPVWVRWLAGAGLLDVPWDEQDRDLVDAVAALPLPDTCTRCGAVADPPALWHEHDDPDDGGIVRRAVCQDCEVPADTIL
ncbi:NUDIX hydrolase [Actinomadura atramentaria]|uniref:NUDIX hydrolase n=1 Tax=Actinomadura atramentaria TaxID=1990 RepID=UPI00035FC42A|nr:NUDIX hydrolase [Actinomadura atramentaria]